MADLNRAWDKASKFIVFVAAVAVVLSVTWIVYLTHQTNTLTQEVRQGQLNSKTELAAISKVQKQVASVIDGLPAADKELQQFGTALLLDIQALCTNHVPACPPPPKS